MTEHPSSKKAVPQTSVSQPITLLWIISGLALVGMGFAIYLAQHFYDLRSGMAGFDSLCKTGQSMNCDVVSASRYAELVPGYPLASFAAGFYLAVFGLALVAVLTSLKKESIRLLLGLGILGAIMSTVYLIIMVAAIGTGCLFCLGIDAVNFAILGLVLVAASRSKSAGSDRDAANLKKLALVPVVSVALMVGGLAAAFDFGMDDFPVAEVIQNTLNQPVMTVPNTADAPSMGDPNAPITLVEFSDFQCPHCQRAALVFHNLQLRKPGLVRVIFRNYPLDSKCNTKIQGAGHAAACEAARGAFCAQKQGKFEPYYAEVFQNQSSIAAGEIAKFAEEAGLNVEQFKSCLDSDDAKAAVLRDLQDGDAVGVEGTPTILINGRKVAGLFPLPVWEKIIDRLLANR